MISSLLCAALVANQDNVAQFKAAFELRKADAPVESPDQNIAKCLELVLDSLVKSRSITPTQIESALRPYKSALGERVTGQFDEYRLLSARYASDGRHAFFAVKMGGCARLGLYDRSNFKRLILPQEFNWMFQGDPFPRKIDAETWLIEVQSQLGESKVLPYELLWMKTTNSGMGINARFQSEWRRGTGQNAVTIADGKVIALSVDLATSMFLNEDLSMPARRIVWDTRNYAPINRRDQLLDLDLRAVDAWIEKAKSTASPSRQQVRWLTEAPNDVRVKAVRRQNNELWIQCESWHRFRVTQDKTEYLGTQS